MGDCEGVVAGVCGLCEEGTLVFGRTCGDDAGWWDCSEISTWQGVLVCDVKAPSETKLLEHAGLQVLTKCILPCGVRRDKGPVVGAEDFGEDGGLEGCRR